MRTGLLRSGLGALALAASVSPSLAATINATAQGAYRGPVTGVSGGQHISNNILAGIQRVEVIGSVFLIPWRNYFTFDLTPFAGESVLAATLTIFASNGTYTSVDSNETYAVYDYTGSIPNLVGGSGGFAAFNDLGSGDL